MESSAKNGAKIFQSTLPARGATSAFWYWSTATFYFNPRSPHGERRDYANDIVFQIIFQSTLPARGATGGGVLLVSLEIFQSTLPARGATSLVFVALCGTVSFQSTLPARGATQITFFFEIFCKDFNPRSPHGERRLRLQLVNPRSQISIHAPRTGSDSGCRRTRAR